MSNKFPVFHMSQAQHFSDYGFDQIDFFQFLEEAKKHKKEHSSTIDGFRFKIQKPMSKDDMFRTTLHKKNKKRWFCWKKALLFFKWRRSPISAVGRRCGDVHMERAKTFRAAAAASGSMSGPVYVTESWSGSSTPYRTRTTSFPYLSLRELNMERQQRIATASSMSGPVYLVT